MKNLNIGILLISYFIFSSSAWASERLLEAAFDLNLKAVTQYIAEGDNPSYTDTDGQNAIHLTLAGLLIRTSSQNKAYELIDYLVARGVSINQKTNKGNPPIALVLCNWCDSSTFALIEFLASRGADVNALVNGQPLFSHFFQSFHKESTAFSSFIARLDPNSFGNLGQSPIKVTPLMYAAYKGSAADVNSLLEKGASANFSEPVYSTALDYALLSDRDIYEKVKILVASNANLNPVPLAGRSPYLPLENAFNLYARDDSSRDLQFEMLHFLYDRGARLSGKPLPSAIYSYSIRSGTSERYFDKKKLALFISFLGPGGVNAVRRVFSYPTLIGDAFGDRSIDAIEYLLSVGADPFLKAVPSHDAGKEVETESQICFLFNSITTGRTPITGSWIISKLDHSGLKSAICSGQQTLLNVASERMESHQFDYFKSLIEKC
jgi:ankyrin repeat protein